MTWIRNNWVIISGIFVGGSFIIGTIINHYTLEAQMQFQMESATEHRERLTIKDEELSKRVEKTEDTTHEQSKMLVRIETQQNAIQTETKQTSKKIDKMDDKLDRLLTRRR